MDNRQRSRELEVLAREKNYRFSFVAEISSIPALSVFEFHTGEKRPVLKIENLIRHESVAVFDVFWRTEFDPLSAVAAMIRQDPFVGRVSRQTMFMVESPDLRISKFHVYPADALGSIDRWLDKVFRRNNFIKCPEFEKLWSVRGHQDAAKYFDPDVIEFFQSRERFWTFASGKLLFIYRPNVLIPADEILNWIESIVTLSKLLRGKR